MKDPGYLIVKCEKCKRTISHEHYFRDEVDPRVKFFKRNIVKLKSYKTFWKGKCKCGNEFLYVKPGVFKLQEIIDPFMREAIVFTRIYLRPCKELKINLFEGVIFDYSHCMVGEEQVLSA